MVRKRKEHLLCDNQDTQVNSFLFLTMLSEGNNQKTVSICFYLFFSRTIMMATALAHEVLCF